MKILLRLRERKRVLYLFLRNIYNPFKMLNNYYQEPPPLVEEFKRFLI